MLLPYKLLFLLLYSNADGIYRLGNWNYLVKTTTLAKLLSTNSTRVRDYLHALNDAGALESLEVRHGEARLKLRPPR